MERHTAGGKVHVEFQFHISYLVSRSAGWLSVCLSTVQETDKIGVDGNGFSFSFFFFYNNVSCVVSQSVSLQGLFGIHLPRKKGKKGNSRSPGCRRKHHGKRKKKKKTRTTSSTMM